MLFRSRESRAVEAKRTGLADVMAAAARWYQDELASPGGVDARAYLARRGLSATAIATFALGYAPDSRTRLKAAPNSYGVPAPVEAEIGRASCRGRMCQDVWISGVAVTLKKKNTT